uniref:Uncharacterized protein n=1 Tax=Aquila chrysaetos chrysaetos TaxID=223781 RepID=A0A663FJ39_AQUCH
QGMEAPPAPPVPRCRCRGPGEAETPGPCLPAVAAAQADVIPGRLPEAEWLSLLRAEQVDRDAGDILAELLGRVMDECTKADVARQTVAFTVGQARDALLQIVQWRFLARDEGETDPEGDGNWQEDEEPEPCAMDSWAQGSVPVLRVHLSPGEGEVRCAPNTPVVLSEPHGEGPSLGCSGPPAPLCPARPPAPCLPPSPAEPLGQPEQGRHPPRTSHGDMEGSGAAVVRSRMTPLPPPSCTSLVSIRSGRPLRSTGAKQEGSGTVLGVPKRGPSSRPQRWIRPQVEVLDPGAETKPPACLQGAGWRCRGRELGSSRLPRGLATAGRGRLQLPPLASPQLPSPMPRQLSSLLDSARLAPGVTVRRDGSVKRGLCIPAHDEEEEEETEEAKRDLRPICPTVPFPAIAARQVTDEGEC